MNIRCAMRSGIVALLLWVPLTACAEITVRLAPETTSLFIYEPFTLRLDVIGDDPPDSPQLPTVPDLAVTSVRRLPADPARRAYAFQVEMIAERAGILTVPSFAIHVRGETAYTSPLRLRVNAPRAATEMTLDVAVEPTVLRVGQAAIVTVTWKSKVPFSRCKQLAFQIPLVADSRCEAFPMTPPVPESEAVGLPVNSIRVVAQVDPLSTGQQALVFRYALVPRAPGVLRTAPARLVSALLKGPRSTDRSEGYFYNHFFEAVGGDDAFDEVYLAATVPAITVRDLAETGRTARYANVVGPCAFRTVVAPDRMIVGQPALFTVHLDQLDFARHIAGLPSAAFDGLRADFQISGDPIRENATAASREFTYILRPLHAGTTRIPAVVIQTFDPEQGEYRTLRSKPIRIMVDVDQEDGSRDFAPRIDAKPPTALSGIRHNRFNERTMIAVQILLEGLGQYWWLIVPLPPLLWIALRPVIRRWERCRRDPEFARAVAAWRRFRRLAPHDEESAWRRYVADRLGLCADALTADTATEILQMRDVDAELIGATRQRFEQKDAVDYGRRPATPAAGTRALVRRLQKATTPLLLAVAVLLPRHATAAERASELFASAMKMRQDKPDQAQPLFVDAALRFESEGRFLNAGNSWFFAGDNGRALANYRTASRHAPFDRQLRESIEFLRANRADAFPVPRSAPGKFASVWGRYCDWTPMLRVGSFVVTYLVAWAVFLVAQLNGWRVRRMVWGVLLVAVLAPLASLAQSSLQPAEGVVIEDSMARLGPGYAYDAAFEQPLHEAAEFTWMERRAGWVRIRLPDDSEGWLRASDCVRVR